MKIKIVTVKSSCVNVNKDLNKQDLNKIIDSMIKSTDKNDTNFGIFVDDKIVYDYNISSVLSNLSFTK